VRRPTALNTGRDWKKGLDRSHAQTIGLDEPAPTVSGVACQVLWQDDEGERWAVTPDQLAVLQGFPTPIRCSDPDLR
jgi:hypothetical protein